MNLYENNRSNESLTVGRLTVLGGLESDAINTIHTHLQTAEEKQRKLIADMDRLHAEIAADGVITAAEKQLLKKEMTIIETEYPIVITKAEQAQKDAADITAYKNAYNRLHTYLYQDLHVFDDMHNPLTIDRFPFNKIFAGYYSSRATLQINADGKDGTTKFLTSLETHGDYENQIGTFQGLLYRWSNSNWELLNAVMPVNPICAYDFADVQYKDVTQTRLRGFSYKFLAGISYSQYSKQATDALLNGKRYRITADFEVLQGEAKFATMYYYDFTTPQPWGTALYQSHTPVVNRRCTCVLEFVCKNTDLQGHDLRILFYNGREGAIQPNGISKWSNFKIETIADTQALDLSGTGNHANIAGNVEKRKDNKIGTILKCHNGYLARPAQNYIGVGKTWSHSRWIKIDPDKQNVQTNPRMWYYGKYDYAFFDIKANNGNISSPAIATHRDSNAYIWFNISKSSFLNNKWHHLVVMIDLQESHVKKIIYLDGEKIFDHVVKANFKDWKDTKKTYVDMSTGDATVGSLAHLMFFDRMLTEQEVLWLYLNPQYPIKNYSLADWSIDPANPDNVLANATPKYLGVVETVPATRTAIITKGERLGAQDANTGDWVLMGKTAGGWKVGVCYRWTGSQWINLEPAHRYIEQYHACMFHICEIEELMKNTGHFGALFAKVLVAQKALIDELVANQAFIEQLIVKRLKIDSDKNSEQDFEAWFDETNGLKIKNRGQEMFSVTPDGAMQIADKLFFKTIKYKDIGSIEYSNTSNETCRDVFMRYNNCTKIAYGYLRNDFIHKVTIQKIKGPVVGYYCFVHLFHGRTSEGFWHKFTTHTDKYIITFSGRNRTYTFFRINTPESISYPSDGTKIPGKSGTLHYDDIAAEKFQCDKNIYETLGTGSYSASAGYVGEIVKPGKRFRFNRIIQEELLPSITLYGEDPEKQSLIMKLENIPNRKPLRQNIVWNDNGILKIT